ncbi:MAG: hypothetical protein RIK87_29170 [Fuerstiella sp.]
MQHHEPNDGLNTPALVTAGLVAAIGSFVLIVGLQALYLSYQAGQTQQNQSANTINSSASLLAEQRAKINRYGWINRAQGVVAIPIDRAIELTAKDLTAKKQEPKTTEPPIGQGGSK